MDTQLAESLAVALMSKHGLDQWHFAWDDSVRRFGACHHNRDGSPGRITLSRPIVALNEMRKVVDVILHEIAHAIEGHKAGHGPQWQQRALALGCEPKRCYDVTVATPAGKWSATCRCGKKHTRHKAATRGMVYRCATCRDMLTYHTRGG